MKKVVIVFLILVLSFSFVSAVWWNPATWFKKNVLKSPLADCPIYLAGDGQRCDPNNFPNYCILYNGDNDHSCGNIVNPKSYYFYSCPLGTFRPESNSYCKVASDSGWDDCDNDGYVKNDIGSSALLSGCPPDKDCDDKNPLIWKSLEGYPDNDGDGWTASNLPTTFCTDGNLPAGWIASHSNPLDCNDNNPLIFPGASEICDDNLDNDCDFLADCSDTSCQGSAPDVPGSICGNAGGEIKKCCGQSCSLLFTYYPDSDGDGFGDSSDPLITCSQTPPPGYSNNNLDCDDGNQNIFPGSNVCGGNSCEKCDLSGNFVFEISCNEPNKDADCKKCDVVSGIADDNSDSSIGPCDKCISGTRIYDALINPANDGDCKKCAPGNTPSEISKLIGDLTDNFLDPDCQKCVLGTTGGEVLDSNSDPVADDCWTCSEGAKVVNENDFPINDGDCKKCDPVTFATINDDTDKPNPWKYFTEYAYQWLQSAPRECVECLNQLPNFDASLNPPNDGDCKRCDAPSLMMLDDGGDSSLIGTCKKCKLSKPIDIQDGGGCNALTSPSMCCGGSCQIYSSNSQQQRSMCCGGNHYTFFSLIEKRRNTCCNGNVLSLRSPNSCGSCDKKCSGSTPYCHMKPGFFEDCYKCAECLTTANCPSGKTCIMGVKKCISLYPPSISGIYTSIINASSATNAVNILKSQLGYSSNVICSGGGVEKVTVSIISIVISPILPPGSGFLFTITYNIVTSIVPGSGGSP